MEKYTAGTEIPLRNSPLRETKRVSQRLACCVLAAYRPNNKQSVISGIDLLDHAVTLKQNFQIRPLSDPVTVY